MQPVNQSVFLVHQTKKSKLAAFLLTLFFGCLGMLYATVKGGLIMLLVTVVSVIVFFAAIINNRYNLTDVASTVILFYIYSFIVYIIQIVWSVSAVDEYNRQVDQQTLAASLYMQQSSNQSNEQAQITYAKEATAKKELVFEKHRSQIDSLKKLKELYDQNIVSNEEYIKEKRKIFNK